MVQNLLALADCLKVEYTPGIVYTMTERW